VPEHRIKKPESEYTRLWKLEPA